MNQIGKESTNKIAQDIQLQCPEALNALNINVPSSELEETRPKKMGSNRRKKQKLRQQKQQSRRILHVIIRTMCSLKTTFEQNQQMIEELLQVDPDEDRFYDFISKVTRDEMDILAQKIHALTANFCYLYKEDNAISPNEIAGLFQLIQTVQQASVQIEKIINFFIRKSQPADVEAYLHKNLELSTLKYIIETDPLKVLHAFYIVRRTLRSFVYHLLTALKTNDTKLSSIKYQTASKMLQNSKRKAPSAMNVMMKWKLNNLKQKYQRHSRIRRKRRRRKIKINNLNKHKQQIGKQKFMLKLSKIQDSQRYGKEKGKTVTQMNNGQQNQKVGQKMPSELFKQ